MEKMEAEHRKWKDESEARDRKEKEDRADWVRSLTQAVTEVKMRISSI